MDIPRPPKRPCGSCPYRKDVPSGIWHPEEYQKLIKYDAPTPEQPFGVFMCHQRDGCLCGGWLQTHDTDHLLSLRLHRVHPSAFGYTSDVETFSTGLEAAEHGMAGISDPDARAQDMMQKLDRVLGQKEMNHG